MKRALILFLTVVLFSFAACLAADSAVAGKWDVTSTDDAGQTANWTIVVKDDGGALSGTLSGDPGEFAMVDPKLDGNNFSFKVIVNESTYVIEVTLDGTKLEGKYKGAEASGTLKGSKSS